MKVAAIIPAYNEESRIGRVLTAIRSAHVTQEILVVSDGSTDQTAEIASGFSEVRVFSLPNNIGKGGAMRFGVEQTDSEVLLFLDADLIGIQPNHVSDLVNPVVNQVAEMSIGVFSGGRRITDLSQKLVPYISGQRVVLRSVFLDVPDTRKARAGIEIALTCYAKHKKLKVHHVSLPGVTHPMKEEKLGLCKGVAARVTMYWEIASYVACHHINYHSQEWLDKVKKNGGLKQANGQ